MVVLRLVAIVVGLGLIMTMSRRVLSPIRRAKAYGNMAPKVSKVMLTLETVEVCGLGVLVVGVAVFLLSGNLIHMEFDSWGLRIMFCGGAIVVGFEIAKGLVDFVADVKGWSNEIPKL